MENVLFSWSSGKDSALALYEVLYSGECNVSALLTTITDEKKVPMHEVSSRLVERQAEAIGLQLVPVYMPKASNNETYEKGLAEVLAGFKEWGVEKVVHADIFLEDVKKYRDEQLAKLHMKGVYPLWGRETARLAERFISLGFRSIVTCVDTSVLGAEFAGRDFDADFLADLPGNVDPCGENGEFHTFVYDGPIFQRPVDYSEGGSYTSWEGRFYHLELV
ncbi:MAG TPA: diphthine--ammonia ligase [Bacillales bacterium]